MYEGAVADLRMGAAVRTRRCKDTCVCVCTSLLEVESSTLDTLGGASNMSEGNGLHCVMCIVLSGV